MFAVARVFPKVQLEGRATDDFLASVTGAPGERVVYFDEAVVRGPHDADRGGAMPEDRGQPLFARAQRLLREHPLGDLRVDRGYAPATVAQSFDRCSLREPVRASVAIDTPEILLP